MKELETFSTFLNNRIKAQTQQWSFWHLLFERFPSLLKWRTQRQTGRQRFLVEKYQCCQHRGASSCLRWGHLSLKHFTFADLLSPGPSSGFSWGAKSSYWDLPKWSQLWRLCSPLITMSGIVLREEKQKDKVCCCLLLLHWEGVR